MLGSVPIPSYIPFFKSKETIGKQIMKMMNVQLAKTQTEKRKQVVDNKDLHAPLFHAPPSSLSDLVAQIQLMQTTLATHGQLLQSLLDAQYKISTNVYDLKGSFSRFTSGWLRVPDATVADSDDYDVVDAPSASDDEDTPSAIDGWALCPSWQKWGVVIIPSI